MKIRKITIMSFLVALSAVLSLLIKIPFPTAPFLIYEPGDIPILIGGMIYGPVAALAMTVTISVLMGFVVPSGGIFGVVMHIIATGLLTGVAAAFYKGTLKSARIGLSLGVLAMSVTMPILNLWLNPIYYGMPREAVMGLLLPAIIPFNLIKSIANAAATAVVLPKISTWWERNILDVAKR